MPNTLETVYVPLLNEGTSVSRPTHARRIDPKRYELLATDDYDSADEEWQFAPGSVVRCEQIDGYLKAVALASTEPITEK